VEAPGTAPGSGPLITQSFIAIAGRASSPNIRTADKELKDCRSFDMHSTPYTLAIAAVLAVYVLLDTIMAIQRGRVPGLFRGRLAPRQPYGPVTRKGRPGRFKAYIGGNIAVFVMAVAYLAAALIFP